MPAPRWTSVTESLAGALVAAERDLRDAELRVEQFLTRLLPDGWQGWAFVAGRGGVAIDVYEAIDSPAAAGALHRAGFAAVTIHGHAAARLLTCICTTREAT